MDEDVYIEIKLPCLPHIGDCLYVDKYELEKKAKQTLEIAGRYAPEWFYGASSNVNQYGENQVKKGNLKDLSFDDAIFVRNIAFHANDEFVHIEIGSDTLFQILKTQLEL